MPRKPRVYIAGVPCHIIQRGNNRQACFYSEQDYQFYLECLGNACDRYNVSLHAYVLMTNHVHLLMTPNKADGISRVMQSLGRRYVQYFNVEYQRSGTLWEGRHKSSFVDAEGYLLKCYHHIEKRIVQALTVASVATGVGGSIQLARGFFLGIESLIIYGARLSYVSFTFDVLYEINNPNLPNTISTTVGAVLLKVPPFLSAPMSMGKAVLDTMTGLSAYDNGPDPVRDWINDR